MARARKTVTIETLVVTVNKILSYSKDEEFAERGAMASFLEGILISHGAYNGFRYLTADDQRDNPKGRRSIGIEHIGEDSHILHDRSRRSYYL